jgi:hypothetical protein
MWRTIANPRPALPPASVASSRSLTRDRSTSPPEWLTFTASWAKLKTA